MLRAAMAFPLQRFPSTKTDGAMFLIDIFKCWQGANTTYTIKRNRGKIKKPYKE